MSRNRAALGPPRDLLTTFGKQNRSCRMRWPTLPVVENGAIDLQGRRPALAYLRTRLSSDGFWLLLASLVSNQMSGRGGVPAIPSLSRVIPSRRPPSILSLCTKTAPSQSAAHLPAA